MISYRTFYSAKQSVNSFQPLFKSWKTVLSDATTRIGRGKDKDHPYWYGERTHVGLLAMAAHERGWIPLQEPSVPRRKKNGGRSDLWIYMGRDRNMKVLDFETKTADFCVTGSLNPKTFWSSDDIEGKLNRAINQAKDKPKAYQGDAAVGLVFLRLWAGKNATKGEILKAATKFKDLATSKEILKQIDADLIALYFAPYPIVREVARANNEYQHIGVAILGRVAW